MRDWQLIQVTDSKNGYDIADGQGNAVLIRLGSAKAKRILALRDCYLTCKAYLEHFDNDDLSDSEMKRWLDVEGIPMMRAAVEDAEKQ